MKMSSGLWLVPDAVVTVFKCFVLFLLLHKSAEKQNEISALSVKLIVIFPKSTELNNSSSKSMRNIFCLMGMKIFHQ